MSFFTEGSVFSAITNYHTNLEIDNQVYQPSLSPISEINPSQNIFTSEDSIQDINGLNYE